jgi:uncharacterized protein (DUF1697 family)
MNTFICLLRGINVSGQKKIRMADLRSMYESLGLIDVASYVQSGNVVFDSAEQDAAQLAAAIKAQIEQTFGYNVSVLLRNTGDLARILANNPFLTEQDEDLKSLYVTFLSAPPETSRLANLTETTHKDDAFVVGQQEIFVCTRGGYGRTKFNNNFFEKKLNQPATTRNWKTITTLYQMANER